MIEFPSIQSSFVNSIQMTDYNATQATLKISGRLNAKNIIPLSQITFHLEPSCGDSALGNGLYQDFELSGLTLKVPVRGESKVFVYVDSSGECFHVFDYTPDVSVVRAPIFQRTSPPSPSRASFTPGIFGSIFPSGASVEFFSDAACTVSLGSGSASQFANIGIVLSLSPETTLQIHAQVTDPLAQKSGCVHLTEFTHTTELLPSPVFLTTTPLSPAPALSPSVKGTASAAIEKIQIYSDAGCTEKIGSGSRIEFTGVGINATVSPNQATSIYAQGIGPDGLLTNCVLMTVFIHDDLPPDRPTFASASPISPTRVTTLPKIFGSAPADSAYVKLYRSDLCQEVIGHGRKDLFESTGITANLPANTTTSIYGTSVDAAGNASPCTLLTSYRHNSIPPLPPIFFITSPVAPTNLTTEPFILGSASETTSFLNFFDDEFCSNNVGAGTPAQFQSPGIQLILQPNKNNSVYAQPVDPEGNIGECTYMVNYAHSDQPAPLPSFTMSFPPSPTRLTNRPGIVGTVDKSVSFIELFSDATCSNSLGQGSRLQFLTAGISAQLPSNRTSDIYAKSFDAYGNTSACIRLTSFTHTTIPPLRPAYSSISPVSPNNQSFTPAIRGSSLQDPASPLPPTRVAFYDSEACISKLGEGPPSQLSGAGITISVPANAVTSVHARAFDAAGNGSLCTNMTEYIHDALQPSPPIFISAQPSSPSYTQTTLVKGSFGPSTDFLSRAAVLFFSDKACSSQLGSVSPTAFETGVASVTLPANTVTPLYAATINIVGTLSKCVLMLNFNHYDTPPSGLRASAGANGGVQLNWSPDPVAVPTPTYNIKRSTQSGGPFTVIGSALPSTAFMDKSVTQGATYYYKVQASNSTGQTLDSSQVSFTVNAPAPVTAMNLLAQPGDREVYLTWTGFAQNMTYSIRRSLVAGGPYQVLREGLITTEYRDYAVSNGTTYFYTVVGVNPAGEAVSSNEVRVAPVVVPPPPAQVWLSPQISSPDCGGGAGVYIGWTPSPYFDNFEVYSSYGSSSFSSQIGSTANSYFVDCNLTNNYRWTYRVVARWGTQSSAVSAGVAFDDSGAADLTVLPGNNEIRLEIAGSPGATAHDIYRANRSDGPYALIAAGHSQITYTDSTVINGASYYYFVQGRDGPVYVGWPSPKRGGTPGPAPAGPSNLTILASDAGVATLNWSAPTHFNRFVIYQSQSSGGPFNFLAYSNTPTFVDASARTGLNYYQVRAQWGNALTAASNTVSFRKSLVTGLAATATASAVNLSWNAFAGALDYRVERATSKSGPFTSLALTSSNSRSDTSAVAGQGYYYRVRARFADGSEGQPSSVVSSIRTGSSTPSGLSLVQSTSASLTVEWVRVTNASSYRFSRATSATGPFTQVGTSASGSATTYTFGSLTTRTRYFLRVEAIVGGTAYASTPLSAETLVAPSTPQVDPGNNSVEISWMPQPGMSSYSIERSTDQVNFTTIASGLGSTAYTDASVTNGQIYFYRLVVVYTIGSTKSAPSDGVTPGRFSIAPQGIHAIDNSLGTEVTLSWSPVTGASAYRLYMAATPGGPYGAPQLQTGSFSSNTVFGLNPGSTYYFVVTSINGTMESARSSEYAVEAGTTPAAPLASYASSTSVQISWAPVPGAATYDLQRSIDGQTFEPLASGLVGTSFTDSTPVTNYSYYYRYQPRNSAGVEMPRSAVSAPVSINWTLLAPTALSAVNTASGVELVWAPVSQASQYEIFRSTTSGSGYSLLGAVTTPSNFFSDATVSPGQTYYYVVRALNSSSTPSNYSAEVSLSISNAPTGLTAVENSEKINLSWSSVGGAVKYNVYRSEISGGPYGLIGTPTTTSLQDADVEPSRTYHYVVSATLASGAVTRNSPEVALTKNGSLDLQVPIEIIDRGIASVASESRVFERSLTRINLNDYDGVTAVDFEIVGVNNENSPRVVELVDSSLSVVSSISIPANTFQATRLRTLAVVPPGEINLRLRLPQTTGDSTVLVLSARLIITQVNATKTKLYFPLLAAPSSASPDDLGAAAALTSAAAFEISDAQMPFVREIASLAKPKTYNAWEIDAVVARTGTAEGDFTLRNMNTNATVPYTLTEFSADVPTLIRVPFNEGSSQFATANEGQQYNLAMRCRKSCDTGQVAVYKAGLWVSLVNLTKAQVAWRTSLGSSNIIMSTDLTDHRLFLNLTAFTNPIVRFQATISTSSTSGADIFLSSAGLSDSAMTGLTPLTGSTLNFSATTARETRRSGPFVPSPNERLLTSIVQTFGAAKLHGSSVLVNASH